MSTKPKTKPTSKKNAGVVKKGAAMATKPERSAVAGFPPPKDKVASDAKATFMLSPGCNAAMNVKTFATAAGELELDSLASGLGASIRRVQEGNLKECEAMLMGQAHSLQAMFQNLAARGAANMGHYPETAERYLRLALKAQGQCRATLETLAAVKNPPVVFARQANIANGPQQVNNGAPAPAGKVETVRNELMEAQDAERVD